MISSPDLTAEEHDLFGLALAELQGRTADLSHRFDGNRGPFDTDTDWYELLKQLLQGEVRSDNPIQCTKR